MFATGLSSTLISSLTELVTTLPELLPVVQDKLLSTIATILCNTKAGASAASLGIIFIFYFSYN